MILAALILSILSLGISLAVYYRCRGSQVFHAGPALLRDVQALAAKQKEVIESATQSLVSAYEQSRRQLAAARETLRHAKESAIADMEAQLTLATEQLEQLSAALEEGAAAVKHHSLAAARRVHEVIAARVRRTEARALLLLARWKARSARAAAIEQRFLEAEELLEETSHLIRRADDDLKSDPHFELMLDGLRRTTREAATSLRAHAELTVRKMERLLAETERLVSDLERDESRHAPAAPAASKTHATTPR